MATANFSDSTIDFWLSGEGFNKTASLCPCAPWLMKGGFDVGKSLFSTFLDEKVIRVPDSHLACNCKGCFDTTSASVFRPSGSDLGTEWSERCS